MAAATTVSAPDGLMDGARTLVTDRAGRLIRETVLNSISLVYKYCIVFVFVNSLSLIHNLNFVSISHILFCRLNANKYAQRVVAAAVVRTIT